MTGHCDLVDALRKDWPEVSDVSMMLNSPWSEGCERIDGCTWALVLVGRPKLVTQAGRALAIVLRIPLTVTSLQTRGAHARTCVYPGIGSSSMLHIC